MTCPEPGCGHPFASICTMSGCPGKELRHRPSPAVRKGGGSDPHPSPANFRILVACEYSATVRDAFRARGFDAWSCDLLPTDGDPRWHIQGDVLGQLRGDVINAPLGLYQSRWDLLIAHPPCTHTAVSGARHFPAKRADGRQQEALAFIKALWEAPIARKALEQPVSISGQAIGRKADQVIQPWQFGHGETKATCLWLHNLPKLVPTDVVEGREPRIHRMAPSPTRWKERSRTYPGIAAAMAHQWGNYLLSTVQTVSHAPAHSGETA